MPERTKSKLTVPRRIAIGAVTSLALFGGYKGVEAVQQARHAQQQELDRLSQVPSLEGPYRMLTVQANQTVNEIVRKAFPEDLNDPDRFLHRQMLINQQGKGEDNMLMEGQAVILPTDAQTGRLVEPKPRENSL